jgi:hypothetical protein
LQENRWPSQSIFLTGKLERKSPSARRRLKTKDPLMRVFSSSLSQSKKSSGFASDFA